MVIPRLYHEIRFLAILSLKLVLSDKLYAIQTNTQINTKHRIKHTKHVNTYKTKTDRRPTANQQDAELVHTTNKQQKYHS